MSPYTLPESRDMVQKFVHLVIILSSLVWLLYIMIQCDFRVGANHFTFPP